ncbi:MAG TPA: DNA-formamidopyrimidine glycosylase family protein [Terriglobia bacterium]|nr:DNA-formamidopyrimidine glycosylase family protein [Terriglobia bacterium]
MPELPDVLLYIECLKARIAEQPLERVRLASPFVLRSVSPPISAINGKNIRGLRRLGKQIILEFEGDLFLIVHLMIAGRFQWKEKGTRIPGKLGLAAFDFPSGTLLLTEAGSKKRASLYLVQGKAALASFDRGALEVLDSSPADFRHALTKENHTLKRALTDPRLFSGIGNAYSDEILHRARLSPMKLTSKLSPDEITRLHQATKSTLTEWIERLRNETGAGFPSKVTAFRPEMAVHGRYGEPCPACGSPVQRIVYAENECNYCPTCQTDGRLLADRAMSRLLKQDWPRSLDEWEFHIESRRS